MDSAILSAAAAAGLIVRVTSAPDVELRDGAVRLSDVAEMPGPEWPTVREIVIAAFKNSAAPQEVRRIDVAQLIRRALPLANVVGDLSGSIRFHAPTARAPVRPSTFTDDRQVLRGDKLTLSATAGPVTVRRRVVALQDATARQKRVFVRSADGEVFAAPLDAGAVK